MCLASFKSVTSVTVRHFFLNRTSANWANKILWNNPIPLLAKNRSFAVYFKTKCGSLSNNIVKTIPYTTLDLRSKSISSFHGGDTHE